MTFLATDLAIFERLVGSPLDAKGRPKVDEDGIPVNRLLVAPPLSIETRLPSYGVRIPAVRPGVDTSRGQSSTNPKPFVIRNDFTFNTWKNVPVFPINIEGREWDNIWPCVCFYWEGELFQPATYVYADPIVTPSPQAPELIVTDGRGNTIASGYQDYRHRPHPDPVDMTYIIRAWSKDFSEMKWMMEAIRNLFPARGVLEVEMLDGSVLPFDMFREGEILNLDVGARDVAMSVSDKEQRHFSRAMTYRIEGYMDNTAGFELNKQWDEHSITQRILELCDMQNNLLETYQVDTQELG